MLPEQEQGILEKAITALYREAGLRLDILEYEKEEQRIRVDAIATIKGYEPLQFALEIKKWVQQANYGALVDQIRRLPMRGLMVADYINPKMADRLKEENIQFIDTAGNAYIDAKPLYIFIKGNRREYAKTRRVEQKDRAFTPTGLKVIYAFLCEPELINAPYRDIADIADVAVGTVGWVINDLKAKKLIIGMWEKKGRTIENYDKLLTRWVETYPGKLKAKQFMGNFEAPEPFWWKNFNIKDYGAYWGGEVAAAKYTKYLKPEEVTIYLPEITKNHLFNDARLHRDPNGRVKIYQAFWKDREPYTGYVHPVLTYADLIATGDTRNLETARMIYDKYLIKYIE